MLLDVDTVSKSYPSGGARGVVLEGVCLSLGEGETLAFTGESGSGKSTLLHLIGGLDLPDSGLIKLNGAAINTLDDAGRAAVRRRDIGIIFQQFNLVPSLTVADNIRLQARLAGREDPAQIKRIIAALGLAGHVHKYPEALSGGQQQRVAIARALAVRPKLVLADEPTGNLDEATSEAVMDELLHLVEDTRCALLLVTHSSLLAKRLSRHVHLSQGQLHDMTAGGAAAPAPGKPSA